MAKKIDLTFFVLFISVTFSFVTFANSDDECVDLNFAYVSEYCDYFNNNAPYSACELDIDDYYVSYGYADPDVNYTESIVDLANRTGLTETETYDLVCHGGSGTGAGGGAGGGGG